MRRFAFPALFLALVLVRVPSLVEPAGADQGLYAYVGQRILAGDWPYRDAWDQKPPGIHATYALMFAVWPEASVVAVTDLIVTSVTALVLLALGRRLGSTSRAGPVSALLFLFLSNPAFGRLGGVRVRGQSEVFIALAVAAALLVLWQGLMLRSRDPRGLAGAWTVFVAGLLLGVGALYKYNAAAYVLPAIVALAVWPPPPDRRGRVPMLRWLVWLGAGVALPLAALVLVFAAAGVGADLYHATIGYNLRYSGETYAGAWDAMRHLVTFPVAYARVDSLWWLGGLGTVILIARSVSRPELIVVPVWVAAACLVIAINGSRGLPQYFVQAGPALALAAGLALAGLWDRLEGWGRVLLIALVATGVWRVTNIPKAVDYTRFDLARLTGQLDRRTYLSRFGEAGSDQKYSALAMAELADYLRANTLPGDRVLVFGFSPGALMLSQRESATRFFWSRPVIVEFNAEVPGYGPRGLLEDLERTRPPIVVLQENDWQDSLDSATYFLQEPSLAAWLARDYRPAGRLSNFLLFRREAS